MHIHIVDGPGGHTAARRFAGDRPLRAPHHSVSTAGAVAELALAAGGVLLLDEAREFRADTIGAILRTWAQMDHRFRPILVVDVRGAPRFSHGVDPLARVLCMAGERCAYPSRDAAIGPGWVV